MITRRYADRTAFLSQGRQNCLRYGLARLCGYGMTFIGYLMNILQQLQRTLHEALAGLVADPAPYAAMVRRRRTRRFGDYQANCAMSLGKTLGKPPRDVAQEIVKRLDLGDWLEKPEIAGPGFINLRLRTDWLAKQVQAMAPATGSASSRSSRRGPS